MSDTPWSERWYHVCGVAGVGMNPLAQALARSGAKVSGSDRYLDQGTEMEVFRKLRRLGITLTPQDGSAVGPQVTALVVSTAIEEDNPDWLAAKALNLPVVHRATLLAEMVSTHRCLAVAGTSGKTTLTGMIGTLLAGLGWDPVVINGGAVVQWIGDEDIGNVRWGSSPWWVIEVDESDRSLLRFYPELAVINNVTRDHFSLTESVELFQRFAGQCQRLVVLPQAAELLGVDRTFPEHGIESVEGQWQVRYRDVEVTLSVPGRHNAENALAALATADALGCPLASAAAALASFRGIHRRLERVGEVDGVVVLDDYAHNPAKIRASWLAAAERGGRVLGVWRPHGYGPLAAMRAELSTMFHEVLRPGDHLWMLPVYYAGGSATRSVESGDLVGDLQAAKGEVYLAENYAKLEAALLAEAQAGDTLLLMGARDPELPVFARRLVEGLPGRGHQ